MFISVLPKNDDAVDWVVAGSFCSIVVVFEVVVVNLDSVTFSVVVELSEFAQARQLIINTKTIINFIVDLFCFNNVDTWRDHKNSLLSLS